ncbi:hypothetical protein GCM10009123_01540 [Kangiella japonica]|uniref:Uncharacterized protein n=1 Tax=Kangiella japonica TaxID=647384 RepID=A0ABN0STD5_9GAMM
MKVAHVCLSCFYIDGFNYQENQLVRQHVKQGHDVIVIASTENYINGKISYVRPDKYLGDDGAQVIRLAYTKKLPKSLGRKLRVHDGFYDSLVVFKPDVVVFHGVCTWEIRTMVKYGKNYQNVKIWYDTHTDSNNSMLNLPSKILHNVFYKPIFKSVAKDIAKILCISKETENFIVEEYQYPRDRCVFFPLGGDIISNERFLSLRANKRAEFNLDSQQKLFVQTGKFTPRKKLIDTLTAFSKIDRNDIRLVIAGILVDENEQQALELIERDERITYLGWCDNEQLEALLCAADVYVQPGTQSATMQMSMCMRCAVIIDDVPSHEPYVKGNGWLLNESLSLYEALNSASESNQLPIMQARSFEIAEQLLDYSKMARKLIED